MKLLIGLALVAFGFATIYCQVAVLRQVHAYMMLLAIGAIGFGSVIAGEFFASRPQQSAIWELS